ncbi:MAG: hypothetical protein QM718_02340 [Steroidobacteraceae bacterium]
MAHVKSLRADLWQARCAVLGILALQWLVQGQLHLAGRRVWLISALELTLLLCLTFTTERHVRRAQPAQGAALRFIEGEGGLVRVLALIMIGTVSVINLVSLVRLIMTLLTTNGAKAQILLADALILFATNVIVSSLWYWELDRGGVFRRHSTHPGKADFLFPQMTLDAEISKQYVSGHWCPHFADYLYVAFTNATAFSPTDVLPLTRPAKLLMAIQAGVSLLTIAFVAARAVNILAT